MKILKTMSKLSLLLVSALILVMSFSSCDKDSETTPVTEEKPDTSKYSLVGVWKTTSAVLNGVEKIGGANPVDSEFNYIYEEGIIYSVAYSDSNSTTLYGYSYGFYTNLTTSAFNIKGAASFVESPDLEPTEFDIDCDVLKINASELQIKYRDYPTPGANYVKKFVKTNESLPPLE